MRWIEVCVTAPNEDSADVVRELLLSFAIEDEGVAVEQLGDPANLDPTAMLPDHLVKLFISAERDSAELRAAIQETLQSQNFSEATFVTLEPVDWAEAWKEFYHPMPIGKRFWIRPSWIDSAETPSDKIEINLDPGMAFGTGKHATTQLCLELLEQIVQPQHTILDLGCGSGILAIGAAKLGAAKIWAIDNDEVAVQATQENAKLNQVADRMIFQLGSKETIPAGQQWDVIAANILAPVLIEMLGDGLLDLVHPNGYLILSGILEQQTAEMQQAIYAANGIIKQILHQGEWIAILAQHAN